MSFGTTTSDVSNAICFLAVSHTMNIQVKLENEEGVYSVDVGVCTHHRHLEATIDTIQPTTKPHQKRAQRDEVMEMVDTVLVALPATVTANMYELDDWLGPDSAGDSKTGELFAENIRDRYRDTVHAHRLRIFTPNLKAAVIDGLMQLDVPTGFIIAGRGCTDKFNEKRQTQIAQCGGLDVIFGDVFGGFDHGVGPLLADLIDKCLLACRPVTYVLCSVSDRHERTLGMTRAEINEHLHNEWRALVQSSGQYMVRYVRATFCENTMQYFVVEIVRVSPVRIPGFQHHEVLVEEGLADSHVNSEVSSPPVVSGTNEQVAQEHPLEMSFFPYDARFLRCHPNGAAVRNVQHRKLRVSSMEHIDFVCAMCTNILQNKRVSAMRQHTMLCEVHRKYSKGAASTKYNGTFSLKLTDAVRAGLLSNVDRSSLEMLVVSLLCDREHDNKLEMAKQCVNEIAMYDVPTLANNCFWGRDFSWRATTERYIRPPSKTTKTHKRHKVPQDEDIAMPSVIGKAQQVAIEQDPVDHK